MAVIGFLLVLFGIAVGVGFAIAIGPVVSSALSAGTRQARAELRESKQREKIATGALRQIVNGDNLAVLTAGNALDQIESNYNKELN